MIDDKETETWLNAQLLNVNNKVSDQIQTTGYNNNASKWINQVRNERCRKLKVLDLAAVADSPLRERW